ncbi:putative F-box domain-containing protein [Arabidopsis thaliana]
MMISDLPEDMVEEILSRVSIISLGALRWNDLSKARVICKAEARQQFAGFMIKGSKVCSMRFDLHGIQNNNVEVVEPSIKQIAKFNHVEISQVFHCDGLLLMMSKEVSNTRLVVWNPYLGKIWSIQHRSAYHSENRYTLGYDNNRKPQNLEEQLAVLLHNWGAFAMEIWVQLILSPMRLHHWRDWKLENCGSWSSCRAVSSATSVLLCSKFRANQPRPRTTPYWSEENIKIINQSFLHYVICLTQIFMEQHKYWVSTFLDNLITKYG